MNDLPDDRASPTAPLERKQHQRLWFALLAKMNPNRRLALVQPEVDRLSGQEIARLQDLPVNTISKRLYVARKELLALVARDQPAGEAASRGRRWTKVGRR